MTDDVQVLVNPPITPDQLFSFYERNNICEKGHGKDVASRVLEHSSLIVAAFEADELVGIARAMFDGCSANISEFSLELRHQGEGLKHDNGSLIEKDSAGIAARMGEALIDELLRMGATFIDCYIVEDCEEEFFRSLGMEHNRGHLVYYVDRRPYARGE